MTEKHGIEKVLEEFRKKFVVEKYARYGGYYNAIDSKKGTSEEVESFLRSAIETAFNEVRPDLKPFPSENDEQSVPGVTDQVIGYNTSVSDYDQMVKKFLGR